MSKAAQKHAQKKSSDFNEISAALKHAQKKITDLSEGRLLKLQRHTNTLTLSKEARLRIEHPRGIHITSEPIRSASNAASRDASGVWWHVLPHRHILTKSRTSFACDLHATTQEITTASAAMAEKRHSPREGKEHYAASRAVP